MNSNTGIAEKAQKLEKQIKRILSKYENKDLSQSERCDAHKEIAFFKDQVEFLSTDIEIKLQGKAKSKGLVVINSLKKLSTGIEQNINDNIPDSEFI